MIRIAFASSVLVLGLAAQPQGGEPARARMARAIKVIPVPQLVEPMVRPDRIPFGTMIDCAPGVELQHRSFLEPSEDSRARLSDLPQLVRDLTPLSWDDGNVSVDLIGDALLVTGSPDQIHLVEQSLQQLTAALGEPFTVRAAAFTVDSGADLPAVAASYTELRARLGQLGANFAWEASTTAAPSQTVDLGTLSSISYVCDCDVEIAQSSTMANPITKAMHLGCTVQVQAHPLAGSSDAVLLVQYARGETAAPMREVVLGKDDTLPRLQSPTVATDTGCLSGRIKNGGALLVMADGVWGGRRFGIVVAAERKPLPADAERDLGVFPLGAFLSPGLRRDFFVVDDTGEAWRELWSPPIVSGEDMAAALDPADPETWNTLFHRAIEDDASSVVIQDDLAVVRGPAASKQTVARLIELMQEQFLKTVEAEYRLGAADAADAPMQRVRLPMLLGRRHCLVHGIETTGVVDADVEVAQKAGISDPKVVRHFTGTTCALQAYATSGNELGAMVRLRVVDTIMNRTFVPENKHGIPLDQPTITRSRHTHQGRVPQDGQPLAFGDGLTVTVNERQVRTKPSLSLRAR